MAKNILMKSLRSNEKTAHLYDNNCTFISYKTGFPVLDYSMGFNVNVYGEDGNIESIYPALGITAGSIVTIVGKSHVGKSTIAIQLASEIVRPFDNGFVIHYDLEGGSNMTRIGVLSKYSINQMREGKYILRQNGCSIEEIKATIANLYMEKVSNPDLYKYNTGKKDEFGEDIIAFVPTCIVIDSIAAMVSFINENTKDGKKALEEISSQTDTMRLTAEIGRFLKESMQMLKAANITMFLINHIKTKPGMGFPTQPELRYLKSDETLPCGRALQYYSHNMLRLTSIGSEKYTLEEHGFDGFGVQVQYMKNRSGVDGTVVPLVFGKLKGYDSLRSSIMYAKLLGLVGGNRNGYYFISDKDKKFRFDTIHEEFRDNKELYKIMYNNIVPILEKSLSYVKPEELFVLEEELNY